MLLDEDAAVVVLATLRQGLGRREETLVELVLSAVFNGLHQAANTRRQLLDPPHLGKLEPLLLGPLDQLNLLLPGLFVRD